ncbi:isochorismatase family protein [Hymenobacter sp. HMF4947]|uniref:Isochorismatase family protein n=1 Tax=Hymenobacter ginkgonis TaxID=2682976 RepID=A0A7K1T8T5_9BACT|nr:cysteine hydrolase [Hymenobacter ginkgonis]MVN74814.1 isochorismatase family protein [Hymenobacter ginkgonis]
MDASFTMHRGLPVPRTLPESLRAVRPALLVYDAQVGIFSQLPEPAPLTARLLRIVTAARTAGLPVFFSRHLSLPVELMGTAQMRMALAWQRTDDPRQVRPWFLRDSPGLGVLPELAPLASEAVFDKLSMSAFEGTWLDIALRDLGVRTIILIGAAMEIGIEPTVRHAADLGYLPIVVRDACGAGHPEAAQRSLDSLAFAGDTLFTDTDELCELVDSLSPAG